MESYKGLKIPVQPRKEWDWMKKDRDCQVLDILNSSVKCRWIACEDCVYSKRNKQTRKEFYEETFETGLLKLTAEVFNGPDCPKWAMLASVNEDGSAYFWAWYPKIDEKEHRWMAKGLYNWRQIEGTFDSSDWRNSLISRIGETGKELTKKLPFRDSKGRFRKIAKTQVLFLTDPVELTYSPSRGKLYYKAIYFPSAKWYEVAHPDEPGLDTVEDGTGEFTLLYPAANGLIGRPIVSCRTGAVGMILYVDLSKNSIRISVNDFDMKPTTKEELLMSHRFLEGNSRYIAEVQLNK